LIKEGKNADAKILIDSALFFLKQIPDLTKEIDLKVQLSKALHNSSAYDAAFATLNEALILKDSLYRVNLEEKLSELNTVYEVEKKESQIASLNESRYKQKLINYLLTSVGIISVGLLLIMIRAFFRKKRDNQVIQFQKQLVEHKNKEITDSINYAKRIQEAILPSRADLASNLSNGFILYKPKDIVAGDFYWLEQVENSTYVAAADCTGHGVPGALVSVICSSALSKTLLEENKFETGLILDRTRELVIEKFSKSEENVQDGMDISLCRINGKELEWSGANNPLWVISDGELLEIKPNKQPIGKIDNPAAFTTHSLTLKANSMVYLFTDGYADQFGGEEGKKFKYKAFKELLIAISELTLNQQKEQLDAHFEAWKGAHEQVDDVCVIGIRC
jgi:serine phosphatase RsbU (regulator of sigma subunit)